jgi:endonuclease/exonuclease/phosphatase family metal-dependent hydrolase
MRSGTYRGVSEDLVVDIRVELNAARQPVAVSGDISVQARFVASFIAAQPTGDQTSVSGNVQFRGNPRLFTGHVHLSADDRGIGVFQLAVDLEGGHRDVVAGRAEWSSTALRKLTIEVDGLQGMPYFPYFTDRAGRRITIESAFASAGFDVQLVVDPFLGMPSRDIERRGFSYAELHRAMATRKNPPASNRMQTHVFVASYLSGRNGRGVLGVMYDFGQGDLNRRPREGVALFGRHPLLSDPRVQLKERRREFVFTFVHEVGHALNLLHSFDKGRPAALSWMNYPHLFPLGSEAGSGHNGTPEFWAAFEQSFDDLELHHLRHATPREISSGGFEFGVYEEGPSTIYQGGTVNPRLTQLGANPLRQTPDVALSVNSAKPYYHLGEPIFVEIAAKALSARPVRIPDALDPSEGFIRFVVEWPDGRRERYAPPMRLCMRAGTVALSAQEGQSAKRSHPIPLFLAARGPLFTSPGRYRIWAELAGIDGSRVAFADPYDITIVTPDMETQRFAERLWTTPGALEALYLRHPLADHDAWQSLTDAALEHDLKKKRGNTTSAYLDYIAALGWSKPFHHVDQSADPADITRMKARLKNIDAEALEGLPPSVKNRAEALMQEPNVPRSTTLVVGTPEEVFRESVPPNGLFGELGLDQPAVAPAGPLSPFIVVPTLQGKPAFADVVSWNIQKFHGKSSKGRVDKIAEYMDTFRCDFWGLQETDEDTVRELVAALNARGQLEYNFLAVKGTGQQSACVFRTDTTRVRVLDAPDGMFDGKITVVRKNGTKQTRNVFPRPPLLCDVRVTQGRGKAFDFRCAVVHTKSTDPDLKDKGDKMRHEASKALEKWVTSGLSDGREKDFLVMGDMKAEEAKQGLEAFAKSKKMKLLSIGMKEKHGTEGASGALTRFASGRLLDHIAITSDTVALMPKSDEKEQIIIRSDVSVKGFTKPVKGSKGPFQQFQFSDHIPVAVRFIIGKDTD